MNRPHGHGKRAGYGPRLATAVLALCVLLLAIAPPVAAQEPPTRIALVDMQRLLDNAPQMRRARDRLAAEFAPRDAELVEQRQRLQQMEQRLRQPVSAMSDEDAAALAREVETLRRSIERMQTRLRESLTARNREERDRVWLLINDAVAQYARDNGLDLVLPTPVLYGSARVDITDRVLDLLRRQAAANP